MTGKKHERDGETYIISESMDLDQLDLENLVNNEVTVPEILKTQYARPPSIDSIPGLVPKIKQAQERIWLEFTLDVDGELEQFPGYIESQSSSPSSEMWRLKMDRGSAAHLMMVIANSSVNLNKNATCTQLKWSHGEEEKTIELLPPSELRMFEVKDDSDSDLFVKVKFELSNH